MALLATYLGHVNPAATYWYLSAAPELMHFSDCVMTGRDPQPSGREGLADVRIIRALYRSARTGRPVRLEGLT